MKIAVQLYGHLRTYKKCYPALKKHLLGKYDCDIFMHTWDTINHNTKTWHKNHSKNAMEETNENEVTSLYHPKRLKIEHQIPKDLGVLTANNNEISIFGIQSMLYSMKSVDDLRQQYEKDENIKYDFVIFIRPDVLLLEDFNVTGFIKNYTPEELTSCVFHTGRLKTDNFDFEWIVGEDTFFFLKPQIASALFSNLENLYCYLQKQPSIPYGPEYFLIQEEEKRNLKPILLKYFWGQHFEILRPFSWKIFRRQLISIRTKNRTLQITILATVSLFSFYLNLSLFGINFNLSIGRKRYGIN